VDNTKEKRRLLLMRQIYSTLKSLAIELGKEDDKYFKDLTSRQYTVIETILCLPRGDKTMINIAKELGTTKQNINRLIPLLEKKGYALRSVSEENRRIVNIDVTEAGLCAMKEHAEISASFLADIFSGFSEREMESMRKLLVKLLKILDKENDLSYDISL